MAYTRNPGPYHRIDSKKCSRIMAEWALLKLGRVLRKDGDARRVWKDIYGFARQDGTTDMYVIPGSYDHVGQHAADVRFTLRSELPRWSQEVSG